MPGVLPESPEGGRAPSTRFRSPFGDDVAFVAVHESDVNLPSLHELETALISPRAVPKAVTDFRLGRAAARLALRHLGVPDRPLARGPHREPVWPDGLVGTITHTGGYALAAVAPAAVYGGLGIDLERRVDMRDISSRIAIPQEQRWLRALPTEARQRGALQLFSAKESVYKAFFPRVGEYFGFERAHLRWDESAGAFLGELLPPLHEVAGGASFRVDCHWSGEFVLTALALSP